MEEGGEGGGEGVVEGREGRGAGRVSLSNDERPWC